MRCRWPCTSSMHVFLATLETAALLLLLIAVACAAVRHRKSHALLPPIPVAAKELQFAHKGEYDFNVWNYTEAAAQLNSSGQKEGKTKYEEFAELVRLQGDTVYATGESDAVIGAVRKWDGRIAALADCDSVSKRLESMNSVFSGDKLASELAYLCFRFFSLLGLHEAGVCNVAGDAGAIAYVRGAVKAGFVYRWTRQIRDPSGTAYYTRIHTAPDGDIDKRPWKGFDEDYGYKGKEKIKCINFSDGSPDLPPDRKFGDFLPLTTENNPTENNPVEKKTVSFVERVKKFWKSVFAI